MTEESHPKRLRKELSFFSVFAIALGTTLSAGFFLLPGLAFEQAGPAVILSYLIAGLLMIPAMLSIVELATAMPRAGGAYYFLDRSLGPLAGTIGGLGTWLALTLKTAFALVGMGAYLGVFFPDAPMTLIACGCAIFFGLMNLWGSSKTGKFQIFLVIGLLVILTWFIGWGGMQINFSHFQGFLGKGGGAIFSTAGLVFISYVGVTNVASISEEVKDPERNLPLGVFTALIFAVFIYVVGVAVMVGHVPAVELTGDLTAVATTAETFAGFIGVVIISIAAILAFSSVANGGILSSSRYPLAMGRDHLLPSFFKKLDKRGIPVRSIILTVGVVILYILFLDPLKIAKLASTFQLLMFAFLCLAVIVMRESQIDSYDPGYRSPLYPWLQIAGILGSLALIAAMGWLEILFTIGMLAFGVIWYVYYARSRVDRVGAVHHVFERLGRLRYDALDVELRGILKEKGLRAEDPFDEVVVRSSFLEAAANTSFEKIVRQASTKLARLTPHETDDLEKRFLEGTRIGATPVTKGIALPHIRLPDVDEPQLVIVRSIKGILIDIGEIHVTEPIHALFFLISPEANPGQHLRHLAQLAGQVEQEGFMTEWLEAEDEQQLKEILLRNERFLSLTISHGSKTAIWIDQRLRDIEFPEECLVALIRRGPRTIVPLGNSKLLAGDQVTIIGSPEGIRELYDEFASAKVMEESSEVEPED